MSNKEKENKLAIYAIYLGLFAFAIIAAYGLTSYIGHSQITSDRKNAIVQTATANADLVNYGMPDCINSIKDLIVPIYTVEGETGYACTATITGSTAEQLTLRTVQHCITEDTERVYIPTTAIDGDRYLFADITDNINPLATTPEGEVDPPIEVTLTNLQGSNLDEDGIAAQLAYWATLTPNIRYTDHTYIGETGFYFGYPAAALDPKGEQSEAVSFTESGTYTTPYTLFGAATDHGASGAPSMTTNCEITGVLTEGGTLLDNDGSVSYYTNISPYSSISSQP